MVYRGAKEIVAEDPPPPKGKTNTITIYFYANLVHNMLTGKAVAGILHYFN